MLLHPQHPRQIVQFEKLFNIFIFAKRTKTLRHEKCVNCPIWAGTSRFLFKNTSPTTLTPLLITVSLVPEQHDELTADEPVQPQRQSPSDIQRQGDRGQRADRRHQQRRRFGEDEGHEQHEAAQRRLHLAHALFPGWQACGGP